ncbi:MAG: FlgD immunoglobulin-like domain containing protein, partial [Candidatus Celaenobacter antarcticus]|nr:FlgD immunoglobulin-like domain containing protein [Candidatus Celaenobacter antarcticus]
ETGFYEYTVTPAYIDDWIPQPAIGEFGLHLLDYLAFRSKELDTYMYIDRGNVTGKIILDTLSMEINTAVTSEDVQLEFSNNSYISSPKKTAHKANISEMSSITPQSDWEYRVGRDLVWFGNMEDEGCTMWELNEPEEFYDNTFSYEGERSIGHVWDENNYYDLSTKLEGRLKRYSDSTNYSLHGYIKTTDAKGVTIQIRYYQYRWYAVMLGSEYISEKIMGDTDWTYYHKELSVPVNTNYFDILLISETPNSGISYAWFDNVGLIEWTDWEFQAVKSQISNPNDYYFYQIRTDEPITTAAVKYVETAYGPLPQVGVDEQPEQNQMISQVMNYPNPIKSTTKISFYSSVNLGNTEIKIFNIKGQLVREFKIANYESGMNEIIWNGKDSSGKKLGNGIYFYTVSSGNRVLATQKCVLLR